MAVSNIPPAFPSFIRLSLSLFCSSLLSLKNSCSVKPFSSAAVLSNRWGLVGDDVEVDMAGGKVRVVVGEEPILIGPASYTADIEFLL